MNKIVTSLLLLIAALTLISCSSDDDPVTPKPFLYTIEVVDPAGNPVSGLDLSLASDLPFYQDAMSSPNKASVRIPFATAVPCSVQLTIEDITGTHVRELVNSSVSEGSFMIYWNGEDDDGTSQASGVYMAHLVALDLETSQILFEEQAPMYMAILDPARKSVGTTDADGLIKLTDKRLFPHLYDVPEISSRDENGQVTGIIQFTDSMRFQLADLTNGGSFRFYEEVTGSGSVRIIWAQKQQSEVSSAVLRPADSSQKIQSEGYFALGSPYPIPFN